MGRRDDVENAAARPLAAVLVVTEVVHAFGPILRLLRQNVAVTCARRFIVTVSILLLS